jgi:hypothetical protein
LVRIKRQITGIIAVATLIASAITISAQQTAADSSAFQHYLDSMGIKKSDLEAKVQSTLMFGGSAPVSFSGEARLRLQYHQFGEDDAKLVQGDRSYLESNWEGNESLIRLGMVVRAGRNAVLWSKLGFQTTLPGINTNRNITGDSAVAGLHDKSRDPANIHEDMNAGIAIRTVPVSFWLKMGANQWVEGSPFTIWKSQPRTFAWEYLPFEVEQPIARYFEYNLAKGEKSGRAAWNKKPFQGINLESINLPFNLYMNFLYGTFERYDNTEREYVDFSGDLSYADLPSDSANKGKGIGDSYRHAIYGQVAAKELFGKLTPALNFVTIRYRDDITTMAKFQEVFKNPVTGMYYKNTRDGSKAFFKEPATGAFSLRGPLTSKLNMHSDIALNMVDTTWFEVKTDSITKIKSVVQTHEFTPLNPAFYLHLESKYLIPLNADVAYISKGFYSPFSFAAPVDAFYPFGSNLLGPGKFIGRGEASPYTQNMAGINLQVVPNLPGYGHLKITYGQHFQIEKAEDLLYFPYRLNGQDFFSVFQSSYARWGNGYVDDPLKNTYDNRLGDESHSANRGGLISDYLGMYECFVPYRNEMDADSNANFTGTIYTKGQKVPYSQKCTFNLEFDGSYDIGPLVGYNRDFFMGLYGAINGVSTSFAPIAFNDKSDNMLLWGTYARFEPAIAINSKFYILGVAGFENWRSQKAYMNFEKADSSLVKKNLGDSAASDFRNGKRTFKVPIDYRDYAVGIGFDWDILARVGLHGRVKWMKHDDINFASNNWATPVISTEIKMWF